MLIKELFKVKNSELAEKLKIKLEDIHLSQKITENLRLEGINTISDLCFKRKTEILSIQGIGAFSVQELEQILADLGLTFMFQNKVKV